MTMSSVMAQDTSAISIRISPVNLSEDMSLFSTKNDELLLLIYQKRPEQLPELIFSKAFMADTSFTETKADMHLPPHTEEDSLFLLLLEKDSQHTIEQIDPVIRLSYDKIYSLYEARDTPALVSYLGKDDLLGMAHIDLRDFLSKTLLLEFKGIQKMDRYAYLVYLN